MAQGVVKGDFGCVEWSLGPTRDEEMLIHLRCAIPFAKLDVCHDCCSCSGLVRFVIQKQACTDAHDCGMSSWSVYIGGTVVL